MRFRGVALLATEEVEPGTYLILGRAMPLTREEIEQLAGSHAAEMRRSKVMLDDGEFIEFLGLRDDLNQLAGYYGDPAFLLQPWNLNAPSSPRHVSCEQALGRLSTTSEAELETDFGIGTDGKFVRKPSTDRRSILVRVAFERADELVAAMLSDTYLFSSAALFAVRPAAPDHTVRALAKASTMTEFRSALLVAYPTVYGYDMNEDRFRITTTDKAFLEQLVAAIGRGTM